MTNTSNKNSFVFYFISFYLLLYMASGTYGTFLPVYFDSKGYSQTTTGILLSLGPFIALLAQPMWGIAGDRAKYKNLILTILLLGSAVTVVFYWADGNFAYLCLVMGLFTFFSTSIPSMTDAITLEALEKTGWKFGPVRAAGAVGFAVIAVFAGFLANRNIKTIFFIYFTVILIALFVSLKFPKVKGHHVKGSGLSITMLFRNRKLMLLMSLSLIFNLALGFYYSYFPIYYKQLGADNSMIGWATFITGISDIPFLLFADRILDKLGTKLTLAGCFLAGALRFLLMYLAADVYSVLFISALHGMTLTLFYYSLATYINNNVPKEFRAIGQAAAGLIGGGIAKIASSFLGGILSDIFGIRHIFLLNSLMLFVVVIISVIVFAVKKNLYR